jgi:hypothetical protein
MQKKQGLKVVCFHRVFRSWVGEQNEIEDTVQSSVKKIDDSVAGFRPYGVNHGRCRNHGPSKAKSTFPAVFRDLESLDGPIHLLIGMDHMKDAIREREKNLALYKSAFKTRYMVCGNMGSNELSGENPLRQSEPQKVLSCRSVLFQPPEFIPVEALGKELPRSCPACEITKKFRMDSLLFKENSEYEIILSILKLD